MSSDNLRNRTARGSLAAGGVVLVLRPLNIVTTIVLARILDPSVFGIVALGMLLITSSYRFTTLGMGSAFIHSDADEDKAAFHAFCVTVASGIAIAALIILFAQPIAGFLGDSTVTPVLRWLSTLLVLESLFVVPDAILRKHLMFERVSSINLVSVLTSMLLSISLAFSGFGLWSLVASKMAGEFLRMLLSWLLCPNRGWFRPQSWDKSLASELIKYGTQGTAGGLITYLHTHIDDWMVGRFLGVTALGYYSKAYDLSNKTLTNLSSDMVSSVFFPSYRKIRDDIQRLSRVYLKSLSFVTFMMTPIALGTFVVAPVAVPILLGSKWMPMTFVLQIYSLMVLTRPISENTHPLFLAVGKPIYDVRAGIVLNLVMVPLAVLGLRWGIAGVALAVTFSHLIGMLYNVYQVNTILPGSARSTLGLTLLPWFAGAIMVVAVQAAKDPLLNTMHGNANVTYLLLLIGLGALVYGLLSVLLQRKLLLDVLNMMYVALGRGKGTVSSAA